MIISIFKVTLSALQITRCFNAVPALSSHLIWNPWKIVPEVIIFNCWEHRSWLSDWSAMGTLNGILFRIWYMSLGIHQTQMMCKRKERQNFIFFLSFCPAAKMRNEGKLRNWCPRKLVLKCHVKEYLSIPVWKLYLAYLKNYTLHTFEIAKVFWIMLYVEKSCFSMKSWLTYMTSMFWILNIHINGHRRGCYKIILS